MKKIARTLEVSVAAHTLEGGTYQAQQRRAAIRALHGISQRYGALVLDVLAERYPGLAKAAFRRLVMHSAGLEYIGSGASVSVYRQGSDVIKIYRDTVGLTPQSAQDFIELWNARNQTVVKAFEGIGVGQVLYSAEHPLGDYLVVQARQPYIEGKRLDVFVPNTTTLQTAQLEAACNRYSDTLPYLLRQVVQQTFSLHDEHELVPDLNGADNFRTVTGSPALQLIDCDPIPRDEHPQVYDHVLRQAEVLGAFVNT